MKYSSIIVKVSGVLVVAILGGIASPVLADDTGKEQSGSSVRLSGSGGPARRPGFYLNFMLTGSVLHEDASNRLTSHDSDALATPGLALRAGGVVNGRHLIGALFQANWRATNKVLDSSGGDNEWGEVANFYFGPEYRYQTSFGLYAGGSVGFAYTFADNNMGGREGTEPECSSHRCLEDYLQATDDSGVPGVGVRAVVGYEYRIKRTLALNIEGFVGVFDGKNEHNEKMNMPTYGLALGIGI